MGHKHLWEVMQTWKVYTKKILQKKMVCVLQILSMNLEKWVVTKVRKQCRSLLNSLGVMKTFGSLMKDIPSNLKVRVLDFVQALFGNPSICCQWTYKRVGYNNQSDGFLKIFKQCKILFGCKSRQAFFLIQFAQNVGLMLEAKNKILRQAIILSGTKAHQWQK